MSESTKTVEYFGILSVLFKRIDPYGNGWSEFPGYARRIYYVPEGQTTTRKDIFDDLKGECERGIANHTGPDWASDGWVMTILTFDCGRNTL